MIELQQFLKLF